jgi:transposase
MPSNFVSSQILVGSRGKCSKGDMKRQADRNVTGFLQKLLELEDPWRVVAVELKDEDRSVEIEVEWPASYKAPCPECGRACAVYDHAAMRWWPHLDRMNRTTRLGCRVPRSGCPTHGVKTMQVPWCSPSASHVFTAS